MHLARRLGLLLAFGPLAGATDPGMLEMIMPDAHVVFGISFTRLRSSPMGDAFRMGIQAGMRQAPGGAGLQNLFAQIGFNPFEDIQEVLVATSAAGKNPPTIVAMRGSPRLRQLVESQARNKAAPTEVLAFDDLLVTGDALQVKAAKARRGRGPSLGAAMTRRIADMSAGYDFWLISNVSAASLAEKIGNPKSPGMANMEMLKSIEQFSAGMAMKSDFVLRVEVVTHDAQSAASLADSVKLMLAMAQQGTKDPAALETFKRLELGAQGKVVKLGLTVPEAEVRKQIQMMQAQIQSAAPAPKPAAPANTDIVIHNSPKDSRKR